jgi:hypothetical protein
MKWLHRYDIPAVTFNEFPRFSQLLWIVGPIYTVPGRQEIQTAKRHLFGGENAVRGTAGQGWLRPLQDNRDLRDTQPYFTFLSTTSPAYVSYTGRTQGGTPRNLSYIPVTSSFTSYVAISGYLSQNAVDFIILSLPVHVIFTCWIKHEVKLKQLSRHLKDDVLSLLAPECFFLF